LQITIGEGDDRVVVPKIVVEGNFKDYRRACDFLNYKTILIAIQDTKKPFGVGGKQTSSSIVNVRHDSSGICHMELQGILFKRKRRERNTRSTRDARAKNISCASCAPLCAVRTKA